jgi:hypothetical protein
MGGRAAPLPVAATEEGFGGTRAFRLMALAGLGLAVLVGVAIAYSPLLGAIAGFGGAVLVVLVATGRRLVALFLVALALLLVGYALFGRGLAHFGAPPIYIGEVVLALGFAAIVASLPRVRFGPVELAILAFMGWGAFRTVPYLATYDTDALRDAVTWGYAAFALAVAWTVQPRHFRILVRVYRRIVPFYIAWVPISAAIVLGFGDAIPAAPGSEVPIVFFKPGDAGVHLAGVAAFILVGLYSAVRRATVVHEVLLWAGWVIGVAVAGAISRGGLISASVIVATAMFVRSSARWLSLLLIVIMLFGIAILANPSVSVPGRERAVSVQQLTLNVVSLIVETDAPELDGTRNWRLEWWDEIIGYTIEGPFLWGGKGFGVNLADDDGFQVTDDGSLRSPHSGHFEILARSGIVGLGLWIAVLASFALVVLRAARRANGAGQIVWVAVMGWLFVYGAAAVINGSFDVYLQGPQGGIWFWVIVGLGIAASRLWHEPLDVGVPEAPDVT